MANILQNRVSNTFTAAEETLLITKKSDYAAIIDAKTIALTESELKTLSSIAVENKVFVDDTIRVADAEMLAMLPPSIGALVPELIKDKTFYEQLDAEEAWLKGRLVRVEQTKRVLAHEAYSVSLKIYEILGALASAGVPGAQAKYDILAERFKSAGRPPAVPV